MLELDQLCMHCMGQLDHPDELCPHCGANPKETFNAPNQLECGSILAGTYLIGSVLGQGGFGITYIGLDLNLSLKVAIKEYYPEGYVTREGQTRATVMPLPGERKALFERGRERYVSEAKTLAKFGDDPSIVGVRTFFYENGTAYIVMNFVEGVTLKEFAAKRGGRLPAREVLAMMEPLFVSLSKVHAAGLLHRDISPDNIMRKKSGALILLDFGAARQMSIAGEHSNTINVKHGFAPEEQYRTRGEQGPWTDVYALSATIYRLTTGVTPPEALDRMVDDTLIVSPTRLGADLSPAQEAALMHGLAVRASARTNDIAQFARELYGRNVAAFTQPYFGTEPERGSVKAENDAKPFAQKANSAAVNQNAPSTGKNSQKNGNQKPSSLIRSAATFVMFLAVLTLTAAAYNRLGGIPRVFLIATDIVGLVWLCLSLGVFGRIDKTRKLERITSIVILSVGSLVLAIALFVITQNPDISSTQQSETPTSANDPGIARGSVSVVEFQDPVIEAGIRKVLNKTSDQDILSDELAYITRLVIAGDNIIVNDDSFWAYVNSDSNTYSIDGGINMMQIPDQTISLEDLKNFSGLQDIDISATKVADWEALQSCTSLTRLSVYGCGDIDINWFNDIQNLKAVNIGTCDHVTLKGAAQNSSITSLSLFDCGAVNCTEIAEYGNLADLSIWMSELEAPEELGKMTNLTSISIGSTLLNNIDFVLNLNNLQSLFLSEENIQDIPALNQLKNLVTLDLWCSKLDSRDMNQISELQNLTSLGINFSGVTDLTFAKNLTNLNSLSFISTSIKDLSPIRALTNLTSIDMVGSGVTDIRVLANFKNLNKLRISNLAIKDFSPLNGLPISSISIDASQEDIIREMFPTAQINIR